MAIPLHQQGRLALGILQCSCPRVGHLQNQQLGYIVTSAATAHCAKLVTHIEKVKVLGTHQYQGSGSRLPLPGRHVREPITGTKDGPKAINWGIPFTARPKAVQFDYRNLYAQLSHPHQAERLQR